MRVRGLMKTPVTTVDPDESLQAAEFGWAACPSWTKEASWGS